MVDLHDFENGHGGGSSGLNIHDPILQKDPALRKLRGRLPLAIGVFVVGLAGSIVMLTLSVSEHKASTVGLLAASILFLLSSGYFALVTIRLGIGAQRAHHAEFERTMAALRQNEKP